MRAPTHSPLDASLHRTMLVDFVSILVTKSIQNAIRHISECSPTQEPPNDQDMTIEEYLKSMRPDEPDMTVEEYLKSMRPDEPDMTVEEYLKSMKPEEPDMTVEEYLKSMKPDEPDMTIEEYLKPMKPDEPDMTIEEYLKSMKPDEPDMTIEEYLKSMKPDEPDMTVEEYLKPMKPGKPDMTVEEYLKSMKPEEPDMTVEEYLKSMKPDEPDMTIEEYLKPMKPDEPDMTIEEYLKSMKPDEPDMTIEEYLKSMKPDEPDMTVEEYLKPMKPGKPDMTVEEYLKSMKPEEPDMTIEEYLKSMKPDEPDITIEEYLKSMKPDEPDMTIEEYLKSMKPDEPDMTIEEYLKPMKPDEPDMTVEEYLKSMKPEEPDMTIEEYLKSMKPGEPDMTIEEYLKSMKPDEPDMTVEEYLKSMKSEEPDMTVEEYLKSMKPDEPDMTIEEYLKSMKPEEPDMTIEEYLKSMKPDEPDMTIEEYLKSMKPEEPDMTVEEYLKSMTPEEPDMTVEEYLKSMKPEEPDMTVEEYLKSMKPDEPDMTIEEYLKSMKPDEPDMTIEEYLKSMKPDEPDVTIEVYLKSMKPDEPDMTIEEYLKSTKPDEPDVTIEEYLKSMKPDEPDMTIEEYLKSMKPGEPDTTIEEYLKSMKPEEPDMTIEDYLKAMKPEDTSTTRQYSLCDIWKEIYPKKFNFRSVSLLYFGSHVSPLRPTSIDEHAKSGKQTISVRVISVENKFVSLSFKSLDETMKISSYDYLTSHPNLVESSDIGSLPTAESKTDELLFPESYPSANRTPDDIPTDIESSERITIKETSLEETSPYYYDSNRLDESCELLNTDGKTEVSEESIVIDEEKIPKDDWLVDRCSSPSSGGFDNLPQDNFQSLSCEDIIEYPLRHCTELLVFRIKRQNILPWQVTLLLVDFPTLSPSAYKPQDQLVVSEREAAACNELARKSEEASFVELPALSILFQEVYSGKQLQLGKVYQEVSIGRFSKKTKEEKTKSKTDEIIKGLDRKYGKRYGESVKKLKLPDAFSKKMEGKKRGDESKGVERGATGVKGKRQLLEDRWKQTVVESEKKDDHIARKYREIDIKTSNVIDLGDVSKSSALEELPLGMKELKGSAKVSAYLQSNRGHMNANGVVAPDPVKRTEAADVSDSFKTNRSPFRRSRSRQNRDIPRVVLKRTKTSPARFGQIGDSEDGTENFTESDDGSAFAVTGSPSVSPRASLRKPSRKFYSDSDDGSAFAIAGRHKRLDSDGSAFAVTGNYKRQDTDSDISETDAMTASDDISSGSGKRRNRGYTSDLSSSETLIESEDGSVFAVTGSHLRRLSSDGSSFAVTGSPDLSESRKNSPPTCSTSDEKGLTRKESAFAMTGRRSRSSIASDESSHDERPNQTKKKLATFV